MKKILFVLLIIFILYGCDLFQDYPEIRYAILITGDNIADIIINNEKYIGENLPFIWTDTQILKPFDSFKYSISVNIDSITPCNFYLYCNDSIIYTEYDNNISFYAEN